MNTRRTFFRRLFGGAAAAVVVPEIIPAATPAKVVRTFTVKIGSHWQPVLADAAERGVSNHLFAGNAFDATARKALAEWKSNIVREMQL